VLVCTCYGHGSSTGAPSTTSRPLHQGLQLTAAAIMMLLALAAHPLHDHPLCVRCCQVHMHEVPDLDAKGDAPYKRMDRCGAGSTCLACGVNCNHNETLDHAGGCVAPLFALLVLRAICHAACMCSHQHLRLLMWRLTHHTAVLPSHLPLPAASPPPATVDCPTITGTRTSPPTSSRANGWAPGRCCPSRWRCWWAWPSPTPWWEQRT
jgi:hypothetical protein